MEPETSVERPVERKNGEGKRLIGIGLILCGIGVILAAGAYAWDVYLESKRPTSTFDRMMEKSMEMMESPGFQKMMESPEFQKIMEKQMEWMNSPEFKETQMKQMEMLGAEGFLE